MVAAAAQDVDQLHAELTRTARSAIELLEPLARGDGADMRGSDGLLRTTGPQIELLVARRGAAYEHLRRALTTYQRLLPGQNATLPGPATVLEHAPEQKPGQDDDWTLAKGRQLAALEAVEAGGLRFHQSALHDNDLYLSDGTGNGPKVWVQTTERLVADGLLVKDTSTSPYQGQLLSLTAQGEAALQEGRSAAPRVSAALSRSHPGAAPGVSDPAPASITARSAPGRGR
ncbi:large ATP-binding protein [Streptomyces fildesensis]|uniref:large ATP-binding protein n=1 Tax=Streptomyces fildesensis TaxID=375757 RepID=UPI0018DF1193|nr:large ATP-binding protein [Streptomyces fildesensis]